MAVRKVRRRNDRPFDEERLEQAALGYAARYATTRARLRAYLARKLIECGWAGTGQPPVEALVERMASQGYVDDRAFATARAAALNRRGYGERRVVEALRAAGVGEEEGEEARERSRRGAWRAALRFAERRRIGPYAAEQGDRPTREKALAALLRAGHPSSIALRIARARPGEIPGPDGE